MVQTPIGVSWNVSRAKALALSAAIVCLPLVGCGESHPDRLAVFPVSGSVTAGGKPSTKTWVTLHALDRKDSQLKPTAESDAEGRFRVSTYETADGAPAGRYAVTIVRIDEKYDENGEPIAATQKDQFNGRYQRPEKPFTTIEVTDGANELPPFAIP